MTERLIEKKDGALGWLVFNNPERRNAVSVDMWEAIPPAIERFEGDPDIRVVVLTGTGDKAFVSGADISQFEKQRSGSDAVERYEEISEAAQARLQACSKPTVAAIRGYCLGAGVNIANVCDLRVAADDARFGIPAARMGLGYRASSTRNLMNVVGQAAAREMLLTARQFTAAEAHRLGLVHKVVPVADFEREVREYCAVMAGNAPLTMAAAKRTIQEILDGREEYDLTRIRAWMHECYESEDYREGRKAFMEKRKPVFKGQ